MRIVRLLQTVASFAAVCSFSGTVLANEPCPTCAKGVTPTLAPKPVCDNKIYPLSEYHYYKRYCGPVISPNATYGFHPNQWRPWDGGTAQAGCAAPATVAAPVATTPAPVAETPKAPEPIKPTTPEAMPKIKPVEPSAPPATNKETIPSPRPKDKGSRVSQQFAPGSPVSPGVYLMPASSGR